MTSIIDVIKNYQVKGSKFGLSRTRELLDKLGSPDDKLKIIHVAGTNGKGSTCAYVTSILKTAGKKVGTYTSPEVYDYCENYRIDGEPIDRKTIERHLKETFDLSLTMQDRASAFEIETCTALKLFVEEGCEYAVVECGMGGLTDSTNAINKKEVALVSSISLEHTQVLGDTILKICEQKAGIIKNCPCLVSALQVEEAKNYFLSKGCKICNEANVLSLNESGARFEYLGEKYSIKMLGKAQIYNAVLAIECAKYLGIDSEDIKQGLKNTTLRGRIEIIEKTDKKYILDGSHNPQSFEPLLGIIDGKNPDSRLIYACLSDKDVLSSAKILSEKFDKVTVFPSTSYRAMSVEDIRSAFEKYFKNVSVASSVESALSGATEKTLVVCGTFTVLKEAYEWIEKRQ